MVGRRVMDETERLLHVRYIPERRGWVTAGATAGAFVLAGAFALVALELALAIDQLNAIDYCRRP